MLIELCNLGRDAELGATPSGKMVANLALAYSVGYGDKQRTQWVDASLWGDRAEKLAPHLTKGKKVMIYADDVIVETYKKNDGSTGSTLKCRIVDIKFAGSPGDEKPAPQQSAATNQAPARQGNVPIDDAIDDFLDDIPFR
jgi:single-strand DNA-binding protein